MIEVQTMQREASQISPSPSFSSYSSETLAEIAARVIDEFRRDPHSVSDDETLFESWEADDFAAQPHDHHRHRPCENDGDVDADAGADGDDFEFAFVSRDANSSPVSADDIFYNGQIRPMYPIFDRNLLFGDGSFAHPTSGTDGVASVSPIPTANSDTAATRRRRPPLRKLMFEERETGSSSSSTSEAEDNTELEGAAAGTYCVWTPKSAAAAESMGRPRKKSNSTGSASKRWNLRDLLLRSLSDGKERVLFQTPSKIRTNKVAHQEVTKHSSGDNNGGGASVEHEGQYYLKSGAMGMTATEGDHIKRKSFLPYRQELVGLFTNVNGLGRNLHPL